MVDEMNAWSTTGIYEIRLEGHLDVRGVRRFEGLRATLLPNGETLLVGPVTDQAALYGILDRIRDMGVVLLAVCRVDTGHTGEGEDGGHDRDRKAYDEVNAS